MGGLAAESPPRFSLPEGVRERNVEGTDDDRSTATEIINVPDGSALIVDWKTGTHFDERQDA